MEEKYIRISIRITILNILISWQFNKKKDASLKHKNSQCHLLIAVDDLQRLESGVLGGHPQPKHHIWIQRCIGASFFVMPSVKPSM